jgi:hypothetical protein
MTRTQLYQGVAKSVGAQCRLEDENYCSLVDVDSDIVMSIEFAEGPGLWIWTCQTVVCDLSSDGPDPIALLNLNDSGLLWCYHALHPWQDGPRTGMSVNLKYTFAAPPGDINFTGNLLVNVLKNMRRAAIEKTRQL